MSNMAALLASLPKTRSWASITCHVRTMLFLEGNSVLIDTRLRFFLVELLSLPGSEAGCQTAPGTRDQIAPVRYRTARGGGYDRIRLPPMLQSVLQEQVHTLVSVRG